MPSLTTLNDFRNLLNDLPGPDAAAENAVMVREPQLTKPPGSLGRLEQLALWLARWQAVPAPKADHIEAHVFAGNHGITAQGVSAYPPEVTVQMVANFEHGGAAINQLCKTFDVDLQVHPLELESPTADFSHHPAMTETECVAALNCGMEQVKDNIDVLCLGEMGIGNTTAAAAICHALYDQDAAFWTGPGTGVEGDALSHKAAVIAGAVKFHKPGIKDGLDILCRLGGRELAAIAGAIVAARLKRVPVLLDGYVCTSAAAVLTRPQAGALDHCRIAHVSAEPGHIRLAHELGQKPLLDFDMRLGEASGAVLSVGLVKAAANCHNGMATFAEAGVTDKE